MSGGSWSYIENRGPIDSVSNNPARPEELRLAAANLKEKFNDPNAAAVLCEVAELLEQAQKRFDAVKEQLHMMEWVDSCDSSPSDYKKYEGT